MIDAENYKQRAFEESVKLWRAEEDAIEATRKVIFLQKYFVVSTFPCECVFFW